MTSIDGSTGTVTFVEAVRAALRQAMVENDRVILLGEDVGNLGGVFRASDGLKQEFGEHRVIDTPMAELSIVGMSIGMALRGLRPIAEIQFADFIWAAADQIFSEAAEDPLSYERRVVGAARDPRAVGRRHPRRAIPLAVDRGAALSLPRAEGRRGRRARRMRVVCSSRRSTTRTRSSCSSTSSRTGE